MVSRPRHGLSLCAGGGGLDLGLMLAEPGFHTRAFVEWEDWPRTLWQQRMRGALSQLPMASGPWIWRPSEGPESPAQMNLFEGLQP